MDKSKELAKLVWRCNRGMLELDLILKPFLQDSFVSLTADEIAQFELLLTYPDPEIYAWLMETHQPQEQQLHGIVKRVITYYQDKRSISRD